MVTFDAFVGGHEDISRNLEKVLTKMWRNFVEGKLNPA
jgi:hypothetical protein